MKPKKKPRLGRQNIAVSPAQALVKPQLTDGNTKPHKFQRVHWVVKVLVFLHVVAITSWSLPHGAPGIENGRQKGNFSEELLSYNDLYVRNSPVSLYILSTGLWQSWDMFSPNPANADIYPDAQVFYKDGEVATYNYPRMYSLSLPVKYEKERYRKFFEHANSENEKYLWEPFAKRVAYMFDRGPSNPIEKVVLWRHWYQIPAPPSFGEYADTLWTDLKRGRVTGRDLVEPSPPHPSAYTNYAFYTYLPLQREGH